MMIQLYIYIKSDGTFLYEDTGITDGIIHDLGEDRDFTLTSPPDSEHQWRWQGDRWVTDTEVSNEPAG